MNINLNYLSNTNLSNILSETFVLTESESRDFIRELSFTDYRTISEHINMLDYETIQNKYPNLIIREATADRGINQNVSSPTTVQGTVPGQGGGQDMTADDPNAGEMTGSVQNNPQYNTTSSSSSNVPVQTPQAQVPAAPQSSIDTLAQNNQQQQQQDQLLQADVNQPQSQGPIKVEPGMGGKQPNAAQQAGNKLAKGYQIGQDPTKHAGEWLKNKLAPGDPEAAFRKNDTLNPNRIAPGTMLNYRDAQNQEFKGRFVRKAGRGDSLIIQGDDGNEYEVATHSVFEDDVSEDNSELNRIRELAGLEVDETASGGATGAGAVASSPKSLVGDMSHRPSQSLGKERNKKLRKKKRQIHKDWGNE